ncbi:MAG: hypothetical protein ACHQ6U_05610 [Thermodesulfobacteriota bacterium]
MKYTFNKWLVILCAGVLVLGLGACKQNQEPTEEKVEEVEVEQVEAPAAQDTAKDMTDESVMEDIEISVGMVLILLREPNS